MKRLLLILLLLAQPTIAQVPGTSGYGILEAWSGGALNGSIAFKVCTQTTDDTTPAMGAVLGGCNVLETAAGNTGSGSGDITTFDGPILPGMILWIVGMGGANVTNIADAGNFNLEAAWAGQVDRVLAVYVQAVGDFVEVARVGGPRVMDDALTLGGTLTLENAETITNAVNGKVVLTSVGGTNNEDAELDLDTTSNQVTVGTNTGVTLWDWGSIGLASGSLDVSEGNITNAGDVQCDSITADVGALGIASVSDGAITIAPNGSGNLILDSGSGAVDIRDFACSGDGACSCIVSGQGSHCFENGIEAQGISYLSGVVTQIAGSLYMKSLNDFLIKSYSDDGVHFCTGDDGYGNNNIIITNRNWYNASHGHTTHSPDPSLWGHSNINPASDFRQYWGLTHNQTASEFRTGTGYHYFSVAVLPAQGNIVFTKQPLAGDKFTVDVDQWEFVASGPAANKIVIGATLNLTVDAAVIRMNLDLAADTAEAAGYPTGTSTTSIHLPADTPGVAGNAIVLTEDVDAGAAFSVTGAGTLTGGRDAVTGTPAAGTNSYFPGIVEVEGAYLIPPRIINAAPTEPVACGAAYEGATVYVDDTNDTNYGQLCICANLDGTGYDWRTVADTAGTACPFF